MRRKLATGVAVLAAGIALSAGPAAAHGDHASCRPGGQLAASLAQTMGAGFGEQVSTLAHQGLADDFVATVHGSLCEGR